MLDTYRTTALAPGALGTYATLIAMADLVRRDASSVGVHQKAAQLTEGITGHDPEAQIRALFLYARDGIRYLKDPIDVEWVQGNGDGFEGVRTLDTESGDCDDKVVLLASLLGSIGIRSRFVIISYDAHQWNHVYLEARLPNRWIALDPTDPTANPGDTQWRVATQIYDIWGESGLGQLAPELCNRRLGDEQIPCRSGSTSPFIPEAQDLASFGVSPNVIVDLSGTNPAQQYFPGAQPNERLDRICNDPALACVGGGGRYVKCLAAGYSPPCNPLGAQPAGVPIGGSISPPIVSTASAPSGVPTWVWLGLAVLLVVSMR